MSTIPEPEAFHLVRGSPAWNVAWAALAGYIAGAKLGDGTDVAQPNPTTGECWQYMGSTLAHTGQVRHEFRHRDHPRTWGSYNVNLAVPAPSQPPDEPEMVQF